MKLTDPTIELVACGSSGPLMPTFGEWERTVLRECYDHVDYVSMHSYYGNPDNDTADFLASSMDMDQFIIDTAKICDEIKAEKKSDKAIMLSFDEWNIWFHSNEQDKHMERWQIAPPLLEDIYNVEDALVVGCLLITLLRHCDRVKIACLAQLVNVIAPIMTVNGGGTWLQTIYYPFLHCSVNGRGKALYTVCECGTYDTNKHSNVPYIECIAVDNGRGVTLFAVNRSVDESCKLELNGFEGYSLVSHTVLTDDDMKRCNSADEPHAVSPVEQKIGSEISLLPRSWNMLKFTVK